ncbi:MAG: pyrroline-5-carboxylate reductase [Sphingobacteriaceae bacterium]|nr:pyrroline-5-carboxylate reductase [Sphingobacteriaceae bacterium]
MKSKICIIGGGNLGKALAEGLLNSKLYAGKDITITRRKINHLNYLKDKGLKITSANAKAVQDAGIVLLCVKPFQCKEIVKEISKKIKAGQIIISLVSGVSIKELQDLLPPKVIIFRAMPNTAMAINQSMTCISSADSNENALKMVNKLFNSLGKTIVIDEKLMDAATILGACGTAFAMRYIRANIQAGIEIGFDAATASLIAAQTVKGAADLLITNGTHPEQEIDKVTTPMGVTITGLNQMEHDGLSSSIIKGINASYKKMKG